MMMPSQPQSDSMTNWWRASQELSTLLTTQMVTIGYSVFRGCYHLVVDVVDVGVHRVAEEGPTFRNGGGW